MTYVKPEVVELVRRAAQAIESDGTGNDSQSKASTTFEAGASDVSTTTSASYQADE